MSARFTPGPWHVEHDTEIIGADGDTRIAEADVRSTRFVAGEAFANARLLAAAPDLLEACEDAMAFLDASDEVSTERILHVLRLAIMRARVA